MYSGSMSISCCHSPWRIGTMSPSTGLASHVSALTSTTKSGKPPKHTATTVLHDAHGRRTAVAEVATLPHLHEGHSQLRQLRMAGALVLTLIAPSLYRNSSSVTVRSTS